MDVDLLTAKAKWAVLERLAKKESSPLEIAKQLNTSVANVSTQLRYLEIANVVKKRRITNAAAGMPRILYSINRPLCIVMAASNDFSMRKVVELDAEKEIMLRIWQLPKPTHAPLVRFYLQFQQLFDENHDVYYADHGDNVIKVVVCNNKKPLPAKIITVDTGKTQVVVDVRFVNQDTRDSMKRLVNLHKGTWEEE